MHADRDQKRVLVKGTKGRSRLFQVIEIRNNGGSKAKSLRSMDRLHTLLIAADGLSKRVIYWKPYR
jgi:hypothetical protein